MTEQNTFFSLCREIDAEQTLWIQGAGGNTSYKDKGILHVKPSGKRLREVKTDESLAKLQISSLKESLAEIFSLRLPGADHTETEQSEVKQGQTNPEEKYRLAIEQATLNGSPRPSMESGFHAWLPGRYVFHFHSVVAVGLAEIAAKPFVSATDNVQPPTNKPVFSKSGLETSFSAWFQKNWRASLGTFATIDACLPGLELTHKIAAKGTVHSIYFLRNHGVILNFDDPSTLATYRLFEEEALKTFNPEGYLLWKKWQKLSPLELNAAMPAPLNAPMKFLFPDMAIMYPRLQLCLKLQSDGSFCFDASRISQDQDALENWLAHLMLLKLWPTLPELPSGMCELIPQLPTEVVRKKVMEDKQGDKRGDKHGG